MKLHVGTAAYMVILSNRTIYDELGNELEGCVIERLHWIVLSRIVEPFRREEVAEHEFYHAWLQHVPPPRNEEEAAQLHACVARQFRADLDAAGGVDALLNLRPRSVVIGRTNEEVAMSQPVRVPRARIDRVECGTCQASVMVGSVHTEEPILHEYTGCYLVDRWMICPACDAVQTWREQAAPDGTPLGKFWPVPSPRIFRGADALAWLAEHHPSAPVDR